MAEGLNRVILLGNLGADPELRMTNNGTAVLKMRLATSETYLDRNKQRQERTEWHNVVVWGRRAEALGKFLGKGDRLLVEGSLRTTSYDDRDGNKKSSSPAAAAAAAVGVAVAVVARWTTTAGRAAAAGTTTWTTAAAATTTTSRSEVMDR